MMSVDPDATDRITHVIVGGHGYEHDIPHREHRLAAYLAEKRRTADVYWVYPTQESGFAVRQREHGILEVPVPARFGSFELPPSLMDASPLRGPSARAFQSNVDFDISGTTMLWFYAPYLSFLSDSDADWDTIIYDCSDDFTTIGWDRPRNITRRQHAFRLVRSKLNAVNQSRILEHADFVYASSERLHETLSNHTDAPTKLEETGVDFHQFDHRRGDDRIERLTAPRLGYVGQLKRKTDLQLLDAVARDRPNWTFVLVGPIKGADIGDLTDRHNVEWLGFVPPDDVPDIIDALDVGLMPYKDIEYNESVFPLKFFEYLAAGVPVVGCGVPSTQKYARRGIYRHTPVNPDAFAAACADAVSWDDQADARRALARDASWRSKFDRIYRDVVDS